MGRLWSILFLFVPLLGVATFVLAMWDVPPLAGHWLPENVNEFGRVNDHLFLLILYLSGVVFVGTGIALFWYLWRYDGRRNADPVKFVHGSQKLELFWSLIPGVILLFLSIYQMNAWADQRMRRPVTDVGPDGQAGTLDDVLQPPLAEVTGFQFGWRVRYPGADATLGTPDDLVLVNDLHVPVDEPVTLRITSDDVIHSFNLPNLRIKQDVVPGMKQFVWFKAFRTGEFDIVCTELCGWGHYKMKGRLTIQSREDYDAWLEQQTAQQNQAEFSAVGDES